MDVEQVKNLFINIYELATKLGEIRLPYYDLIGVKVIGNNFQGTYYHAQSNDYEELLFPIDLIAPNINCKISDNQLGVIKVVVERLKQLKKYSVEHDVNFNSSLQLVYAAATLVNPKNVSNNTENIPLNWNVDKWKSMLELPYENRLIIAGALIVAELDRIQFINKNKKHE